MHSTGQLQPLITTSTASDGEHLKTGTSSQARAVSSMPGSKEQITIT